MVDRESGHRGEIPVVGRGDVADIAVGKHLAGLGLGGSVYRHPRVGAADPQYGRVLLVAEVGEVVPVLLENLGNKAPVPIQQCPDHCPLPHSVLMAGIVAR